MKKLLFILALLTPVQVQAQAAFWWGSNTISTNINGGTIQKGDFVELEVKLNPAGTNIRSAYFDFQHQKDAISLVSVERGPAIPQDANFNVSNYFYPNCQFNRNGNNVTNVGWTNYLNANYTCDPAQVPHNAINRIMVNVSTNTMLLQATYIKLKFEITNTEPGFPYDSIYMNFAYGYDANGSTMQNTENVGTKGVWIELDPSANSLVAGNINLSPNLPTETVSNMFVDVTDVNDPPTSITSVPASTGQFNLSSELAVNTPYRFRLFVPSEYYNGLSVEATSVSDYTTAIAEFITQNLDGTYKNNNIDHGIKYWAADVNNDNVFNGEDVQILFNAVTGLDTIMVAPEFCGQGCSMSVPVFNTNAYNDVNFDSWKTIPPPSTNYVELATTTIEQQLSMNYVLKGDVNLSHSSPLTEQEVAPAPARLVAADPSIDVNLTNVIVTNDNITIPFEIDTNGEEVSALQFEVRYDPTKVRFDELLTDTPSWVNFVNNGDGVVKFGGLDPNLKNTISGGTPFTLKFSSIAAGVDMNSQVSLTRNLDAANARGDQLGIKLNTTVVKLVGVNNFKGN